MNLPYQLYLPSLNNYLLIGDGFHFFAVLALLFRIWNFKTCAGISGRSQLLMLTMFLYRYMDLAVNVISVYNEVFKIVFIFLTLIAVYSIFFIFRSTYDEKNDDFPIHLLVIQSIIVGYIFTAEYELLEILWTISIHLEVVALIPQLWLCYKAKKAEPIIIYYIMTLGLYRTFYIFNWIIRYEEEGFLDIFYYSSGVIQVIITFSGLFYIMNLPKKSKNVEITFISTDNLSHLTKAVKKILKEKKQLKKMGINEKLSKPIIFQEIPVNSLIIEEKNWV